MRSERDKALSEKSIPRQEQLTVLLDANKAMRELKTWTWLTIKGCPLSPKHFREVAVTEARAQRAEPRR